jgi:zinc transport system ATP-binding protein
VSGEILTGDGLRPNEIGYLPQQSAAQKDFPAGVMEVVLSGRQSKRGPRSFFTWVLHIANWDFARWGYTSL